MGKASREKGARAERELARLYRENGFEDVERVPNSGGLWIPGDLSGVDGIHVEVKFQERLNIWAAIDQAAGDCPPDCIPAVHYRRSRTPWQVSIPLHDFFYFIRPDTEET